MNLNPLYHWRKYRKLSAENNRLITENAKQAHQIEQLKSENNDLQHTITALKKENIELENTIIQLNEKIIKQTIIQGNKSRKERRGRK